MKFLKKYKDLILIYVLYAMALAFIFSQNGCASKHQILVKDGIIKVETKVVVYSTGDCYYCDKAKEFFKKNEIRYIEKNFGCWTCRRELFTLAKKLKFDVNKLDGVPIIIINDTKIIVGYSPEELACLLLNKSCKRVYNRYMDTIRIRK